uniref:Adenosine kinase n=1 Tax=Ceratitis capitata TaxID=7213 RepID=W8C768_CERCA
MSEEIKPGVLVGCGNPLLDISATVDEHFLQKYGLKPNDAILAEEKHMPLYKDLVEKYNADYIAGGSVQNSLRVCQWILQKPNTAIFFGCIGQDKYGEILDERARSNGVDVHYQRTNEAPTGTCGVLITGTHRSLCANLAAANHFTIDHLLTPDKQKLIDNAEFFYISGFFLTVSPPSIQHIAQHAHKHKRTFLMNLSAPFLSQFFTEPLMAALPYVDILFGNELEAEAFAAAQGWEEKDMKEIGKKMLALPKQNADRTRIVVLTQGHLPVLLIQEHTIEEFPVERLEPDEIVDTNGAGDAFVGGFLAQYIQKKSLGVCIRSGIWAARQIIKRSGCTFEGTPDFNE